jgi:hypothetical protein
VLRTVVYGASNRRRLPARGLLFGSGGGRQHSVEAEVAGHLGVVVVEVGGELDEGSGAGDSCASEEGDGVAEFVVVEVVEGLAAEVEGGVEGGEEFGLGGGFGYLEGGWGWGVGEQAADGAVGCGDVGDDFGEGPLVGGGVVAVFFGGHLFGGGDHEFGLAGVDLSGGPDYGVGGDYGWWGCGSLGQEGGSGGETGDQQRNESFHLHPCEALYGCDSWRGMVWCSLDSG